MFSFKNLSTLPHTHHTSAHLWIFWDHLEPVVATLRLSASQHANGRAVDLRERVYARVRGVFSVFFHGVHKALPLLNVLCTNAFHEAKGQFNLHERVIM